MNGKSRPDLITDCSGAVAIVVALGLPLFMGGLGFGAETGYWYFSQRKLQNAADVAAYAAATELRAGRSAADQATAAAEAATETGYLAERGEIATRWPPAAGAYAGDASAVEIELQERVPRLFSSLFADGDVTLAGRAVARVSDGVPTCVLALHPSRNGAVTFTGSTDTILVGCNVHSNSIAADSVEVIGSADVQTACLSASGAVVVSASLALTECVAPYEHADVVPDPYRDVEEPTGTGCKSGPKNNPKDKITMSPGCFNSLDLKGTVSLDPGVYVVKGDVQINSSATVTGTGVTIYFEGTGAATFNGGATIQLSAPTTGAYAGMLLFGDRDAGGVTHRINGNSNSFFNGAIYAAASDVSMLGGGQVAGGCSQIVAQTITFSGNSQVGMDCTGWPVEDIRSSRLITLVE
jgi:hypothetical protein